MQALLTRDELVCAEEFEVLDAIATWYRGSPTRDKHAALPELLPLVRWPLVREARRAVQLVRSGGPCVRSTARTEETTYVLKAIGALLTYPV